MGKNGIPVAVYQGRDSVTPGLWSMTTKQYHEGPAPAPELSSSVLQALLGGSPLHAWASSSRLNPDCEHEDARRMEIGSVAHKLVLGAGADIVTLNFKDYRKKEAQEARADATAAGKIPVLLSDFARADQLAAGLREAVEAYMGLAIEECLREVVVIWRDPKTGCYRKAMIDCATPDLRRLCDIKTTETSVAPGVCKRRVYDSGYHIQAAFYTAGLDAIDPAGRGLREFAFIFAETLAPYAVSPPVLLSEAGREMGAQQVAIGSAKWDACLQADQWPGYSADPLIAEPPPWILGQWNERMMSDETLNP